jgi:hypothetical protein
MTSSGDKSTPKSKLAAAHYYVSTVHDITSGITNSNPENSNPVFVSGNTLTSKQLKLAKFCIRHFE